MKKLTSIIGQFFGSRIDSTNYDSGISYSENSNSAPIYVRKINGATSEQTERITFFIERELKWLDSTEYVSRKQEATGMSEDKIKKDVERIKGQLAKTEINFLDENADLATGVYCQDKKNPIINIFGVNNEDLTLNSIDHEIKHALSEQALETMDPLIRIFTSNYKNYPRINNKRLKDYLIPVETLGKWASNASEQQVISKRIMDIMETNYGIKRGTLLTTDDLKKLTDDLNYQFKERDERNGDIITMLYKMKQKHKDSYKHKLCEMVNKAF